MTRGAEPPVYRPSFTRLALILAAALAIMIGGYQFLGLQGSALQLRIEAPQDKGGWFGWMVTRRGPLDLPQPEGASFAIDLTFSLRNRGWETVTARTDDPCTAASWYVEEAPGVAIAAKGGQCETPSPAEAVIRSGESVSVTETVAFAAPGYDPGRIYRIHVRYYGVEGYTDIRFVKP
jgi:hypothetical protein